MALIFGDEQTTAYVKYNAKEKLWSINDADGEIVNIDPPQMLIDLNNLKLGWFRFRESQAPDVLLDVDGVAAPEPDGDGHKRGFRVETFSTGYRHREFTSSSLMLKTALKALFAAWERERGREITLCFFLLFFFLQYVYIFCNLFRAVT